jgi:threonine dehydrogenase-like Zn-dependent dehydrogenase
VTSCAICGSDLHLFHNFIPAMLPGDIMGHEMMGEVVEVGSGVNGRLKKGDRIVVPFTIICGECDQCKRGNFSVCERTNRKKDLADKVFGHGTAGLFGYTHLTGGYPGGPGRIPPRALRRSHAHQGADHLTDEQVLFLGDILPTGWQAAAQCDIEPTDTVAVWGCGPVGQMAIRSAILLGAKAGRGHRPPARAPLHGRGRGAITINFEKESVIERLEDLTDGKGPEKCIDAVGLESHVSFGQPDTLSTAPSR